jgi:uncharacterized protein YkwD
MRWAASTGPSTRGVIAFVAALWACFTVAERPLHALVGDESAIHARVNRVRGEHKLIALRGDDALAAVARAHAEEMAQQGYLSHVNPRGQNPLDRVQAAGISGFKLLAENIGATSKSGDRVEEIVRGWMDSPIHRENLLNPAFNTAGVAVIETRDGTTIAVQLYATY